MPQIVPGEIQAGCQEMLLFRKSGQALEWSAQGGSGVTDPGGRCIEEHGLVRTIGDMQTVGLDDFEGLF